MNITSLIVNICDDFGNSFGTGFFISPDGYILTCWHVLTAAGYRNAKDVITYRCGNNKCSSKLIASNENEDLAILQSDYRIGKYIPLCDRIINNVRAEAYGFPNGSKRMIKAAVRIDMICDDGNSLQLGDANVITYGFSGAPVLYDGKAAGIVNEVTKEDKNGRLGEIAFAISADKVYKTFPELVSKEKKSDDDAISDKLLEDVQALYKKHKYVIRSN